MQFVEVHVVEFSQNLKELQAQEQHSYWNKFFFLFYDDGYEIPMEKPSYIKQCVVKVFINCTKDFNEKTYVMLKC